MFRRTTQLFASRGTVHTYQEEQLVDALISLVSLLHLLLKLLRDLVLALKLLRLLGRQVGAANKQRNGECGRRGTKGLAQADEREMRRDTRMPESSGKKKKQSRTCCRDPCELKSRRKRTSRGWREGGREEGGKGKESVFFASRFSPSLSHNRFVLFFLAFLPSSRSPLRTERDVFFLENGTVSQRVYTFARTLTTHPLARGSGYVCSCLQTFLSSSLNLALLIVNRFATHSFRHQVHPFDTRKG